MAGISLYGMPPIGDRVAGRRITAAVLWSVCLALVAYYLGYMTARTQLGTLYHDTMTQCVTTLDAALDVIKTTEDEIHLKLEDVWP